MMYEEYRSCVFESGTNGYHTYRIPVVLTLKSGKILAFCEGRKESSSDYGEINIVLKTSDDNGRTWSGLSPVTSYGDGTAGNPVPFEDLQNNRIVLLTTVNLKEGGERLIRMGKAPRDVYVLYSYDHGVTWSDPKEITESVKLPGWGWYATGPCHGLVTKSGRMIAPCNHSIIGQERSTCSHVIYSDDNGDTWHIGGFFDSGTNESVIAQLDDGTCYINARVYPKEQPRYRKIAFSTDEGITWKDSQFDTALPDPCCQGSVISTFHNLPDQNGKTHLFFSNANSQTERKNMTVKMSTDNGHTWCESLLLYEGFSAYSDLTILCNGKIGCLFEKDTPYKPHYATIEFSVIG